jgi:hypothetical protein
MACVNELQNKLNEIGGAGKKRCTNSNDSLYPSGRELRILGVAYLRPLAASFQGRSDERRIGHGDLATSVRVEPFGRRQFEECSALILGMAAQANWTSSVQFQFSPDLWGWLMKLFVKIPSGCRTEKS